MCSCRTISTSSDRGWTSALPEPGPHLGRVGVEGGDHVEASLGKAAVVTEGLAQVARPDQGHVVLPVEPELAVDLLAQQLGVVTDAAGAVGAQVGKILAYLGGVDTGAAGQLLRRDGDHPVVVGVHQGLEVQREAFDGCFGQRPGNRRSRGARPGGYWHRTMVRRGRPNWRGEPLRRRLLKTAPVPRGRKRCRWAGGRLSHT